MIAGEPLWSLGTVLLSPYNPRVGPECITPVSDRRARYSAFLAWVLLFVGLAWAPAPARSKPSVSRRIATDRGYASALAAANRFLQAWQNQDHETGLLMLTDAAREHSSEERMQAFFAPGPDGAYEISRGKRLKAGRYVFPATLFAFQLRAGGSDRPQKWEMVVVRAGKDEWAIDRLP
jgi:hypothetical protein